MIHWKPIGEYVEPNWDKTWDGVAAGAFLAPTPCEANMPKMVFYARVSTRDQNPSLQIDAARQIGVASEFIFVEKASGVRHDRPVLAQALAALKPGDTLACFKLDRVGRSLAHLTKLLADLEAKRVNFRTSRSRHPRLDRQARAPHARGRCAVRARSDR